MNHVKRSSAQSPAAEIHLDDLDRELIALARSLPGSILSHESRTEEPLSPAELDRIVAALISLQRGLTDKRSRVGTAYMDEAEALSAYLLFYWQTSWAQMHGLVHMTKSAIEKDLWPWPAEGLTRILDLGSGPGPAGIALAEALGLETCHLTFCDRSPMASSCAQKLAEARGFQTTCHAPWLAGFDPPPEGSFDFVVLSHLLNELGGTGDKRHNQRLYFIESLLASLAPGGALLVLEPALLSTSRDLLFLRDSLAARGLRPLAPCFHDGPCPARTEDNQSCHSEFSPPRSSLVKALSRKTGLDRSTVKTCCFFFMRVDEAPVRKHAWRVVSEQRVNKAGRSRVSICGPAQTVDGASNRFNLSSTRRLSADGPAGNQLLSRSDAIVIHEPETRETGWGIGAKTRIERISP